MANFCVQPYTFCLLFILWIRIHNTAGFLLLTPTCKNTNTALYGAFTADIPTFTLEQMDTTDEKNEIKES